MKMRWPWVSRLAYEQVVEQNRELLDHLIRMDRTKKGRPEQPVERRPPREDPVTQEMREAIEEFDNPAIKRQLMFEAKQALREGARPDEVLRRLEGVFVVED